MGIHGSWNGAIGDLGARSAYHLILLALDLSVLCVVAMSTLASIWPEAMKPKKPKGAVDLHGGYGWRESPGSPGPVR